MISVLAKERLLGATLGGIFTGIAIFEQRKFIYKSISDDQSQSPYQSQVIDWKNCRDHGHHPTKGCTIHLCSIIDPIFGKKSRSDFAYVWNKAVDQTFGPLIVFLSSRGW
ncbi:Zinc finger, C3HC4 type family protein [Quillaja saponaria]|uniref:Zinc finger, C3HC4 type family protein n=1 Tax=Quillaja saponaria TaxID=32244 RepID=A0AAD7VML5_QUISA|nr:Zinc finger, C3HC4 type family protein [Quillaja saponaria]